MISAKKLRAAEWNREKESQHKGHYIIIIEDRSKIVAEWNSKNDPDKARIAFEECKELGKIHVQYFLRFLTQ